MSRPSISPPTRPRIVIDGRRIGRYELRYELSAGGMGTVYLARAVGERGLMRAVALKCIHPHLARSEELVDMFFDEVSLAARIQHPNVCPVFDFGVADGTPYLAMEFIRGETLAAIGRAASVSRIEGTTLARRVCRILADACEGLHAAHELHDERGELLGVVHRDVTPRNLFLGYDGLARVVDFGVAQAAGKAHQTDTGHLKGTLGYVSPEYLESNALDRRADVFSVGVVAWELLTGQKLFRRDSDLETLRAITDAPILAPSQVRPGLPRVVDDVVLRALERDPAARWPDARSLGSALHDAGRHLEGPAHPAELAGWMEELFPGLGREKETLVASTLGEGFTPSSDGSRSRITAPVLLAEGLASPRTTELSVADLQGKEVASPPAPRTSPAPPAPSRSSTIPPAQATGPHLPPPPPRPRVWPVALVGGLIGALLVLLLVVVLDRGRGPEEVRFAVSEGSPALPPLPSAPSAAQPPDTVAARPAGDRAPSEPFDEALDEEDDATELEGSADDEETLAASPRGGRRSAARRAAARAPGHVNVSCRGGWADIYHRGRLLGRTPLRVALPAGRQVLELRPSGGASRERVIVFVPAGGETTASISI